MPAIATVRLSGGAQFRKNLKILQNTLFYSDDLYSKLGTAVEPIVTRVKANVSPYSVRVENSVTVWKKQPRSKPKKTSVVILVEKKQTMLTWIAGRHPTSPRAKKAPGELVDESYGTMLEIGTSKTWSHNPGRPAHYFFRRAVDDGKSQVVNNVFGVVKDLITNAEAAFVKAPVGE